MWRFLISEVPLYALGCWALGSGFRVDQDLGTRKLDSEFRVERLDASC